MPYRPVATSLLNGKFSLALLSALIMPASGYAENLPVGDGRTTAPIFIPDRFGAVAQKLHGWDAVIGAGVMYRPKYEGSREMEISPVPFVSVTFFDRLTIDSSGIGVKA